MTSAAMKLIATLATDQLTRANTRFSPGALVQALQENWEAGIPGLVSHDMSRPFGWTYPTAVFFAPSVCRLTAQMLVADSPEERANLGGALTEFRGKKIVARQDEFATLLKLLAAGLSGDLQLLVAECVAVFNIGIATRVAAAVFKELDGDGLIDLSKVDVIGPGVYRHGPLALFAHRDLRRSGVPVNSLNAPFLSALAGVPAALRPRVALDPDMVGLAESYRPIMEQQYWWGPEFNDDLSTIPAGVSQHRATDAERFYSGIEFTDFRWGDRDGERIFAVEEVRAASTFGVDGVRYACRYAHSIVAPNGNLDHFDGAVRIYDEDGLTDRRGKDLSKANRAPDYLKLWRVDGDIPVALWKRLLSDYFRDNHLVGEYLGAPPAAQFGPIPAPEAGDAPSKDSPASFRIARGGGIRAGMSFLPLERILARDRLHILPARKLEIGDGGGPFVEAESLELVKAVARHEMRIELNADVLLVKIEDLDVNFGTVWHPEVSAVATTIEALQELVRRYVRRSDRLIGFSIAYPIGCSALIVSVCGHLDDVAEFLPQWSTVVAPLLGDPVRLGDALKKLVGDGDSDEPRPDALECLTLNRVLEIDRLELERGLYDLKVVGKNVLVEYLPDPDDKTYPAEAARAGCVVPAVAMIVDDSECSLCTTPYRGCPCSKVLDDDCTQIITKWSPVAVYLTPRPSCAEEG